MRGLGLVCNRLVGSSMGFLKTLLGASVLVIVSVACAATEYPTPLPTATPFVLPSPLPTATPAPTATPIVLPSPLPTATPQSVVYPTPLPTATPAPTATPIVIVLPSPLPTSTPVVLPTPMPTPTPQSFVYPTPLPTATPVVIPTALPTPTPIAPGVRWQQGAFAGLSRDPLNGVLPVQNDKYQVGTAFVIDTAKCQRPRMCLLTAGHVADGDWPRPRLWLYKRDAYLRELIQLGGVKRAADIDLAVAYLEEKRGPDLKMWELAPEDYKLQLGQPLRAVVIDFRRSPGGDIETYEPYVLDGVVASVSPDRKTFMFSSGTIPGNSGGVVLNANMQVVGLVTHGYTLILPAIGYPDIRIRDVPSPGRTRAVHIHAIRQQLREWGLLD